MNLKYNWKYGENPYQRYYDARVNGNYLCVFENKHQPGIWMGMQRDSMIHNKTLNDRQRKKQGLPKGCSPHELHCDHILCNASPEYMMQKVEHCYRYNKIEVSR